MGKADCHMHMVLDGSDWRAAIARHRNHPDEHWIRDRLADYRAAGYVWLRDGGDRWGVGAKARALAPEYGIVYRTPLAPLCKAGHYGSFIGEKYENLREYGMLVKKARLEGADFIKIMISGLMDFHRFGVLSEEGLPPEEIRELVHIARSEGFRVMAHCNGARTAEAAAAAGVDSIEHGAYLDGDALAAMAESQVIWVPTLSTIANLRGMGRFPDDQVQRILDSARQNLAAFAGMGGIIAPGSDAGAWSVPHGCLTEYGLLEEIIPPDRIRQGAKALMARF